MKKCNENIEVEKSQMQRAYWDLGPGDAIHLNKTRIKLGFPEDHLILISAVPTGTYIST